MAASERSSIKTDICLLGQAVTFFLHKCPGFNKQSMLWAQGLLHLVLLFYCQDGSLTSYAEVIRTKLRCFQVHPMDYTWSRFQAQNAVYMKVIFQALSSIGSLPHLCILDNKPVSFPKRVQQTLSGKEVVIRRRGSSRASHPGHPVLGFKQLPSRLHLVSSHSVLIVPRSMDYGAQFNRDVAA